MITATTATTSTMLLDSFPAPPMTLPSSSSWSSTLASNPPPTRPPTAPLPPIPGPSRLSETDTLLFLSSSRNSHYSAASRPDSIASVASARSNGTHYSHSPNSRREKRDSSSSFSSTPSKSTPSLSDTLLERREDLRRSRLEEEDDLDSAYDPSEAYGGTLSSEDEAESLRDGWKWRGLSSRVLDDGHDEEEDGYHSLSLSSRFPIPPPLTPRDHSALASKRSLTPIERSPQADTTSDESIPREPEFQNHGAENRHIPEDYPAPPHIRRPPPLRNVSEQQSQWLSPPNSATPTTPSIFNTPPTPQLTSFVTDEATTPPASTSRHIEAPPAHNHLGQAKDTMSISTSSMSIQPSSPLDSTEVSGFRESSRIQFPSSKDPFMLHRELRSARSRSPSHRQQLNNSAPSSPGPAGTGVHDPPAEAGSERPPLKRAAKTMAPPSSFKAHSVISSDGRSGSPDIETLMENTPRLRRSSSGSGLSSNRTNMSSRLGSRRSRSASRPRKSRLSITSSYSAGRASDGPKLARELDELDADDDVMSFRASRRLTTTEEGFLLDEDEDGSASDSSLDVHTPLPTLLLRDGVLSHKSKLLTSSSTDSLLSLQDGPGKRPDSMMSYNSIDSKASVLKDTRDTRVRRLRHKDGKVLREGLGLTTGLGWSDSEDEDAPSLLTKQLSSALSSRRSLASVSSFQSTRRSISSSKSYGNLRSSSYSTMSAPSTAALSRSTNGVPRSRTSAPLLETDSEGEGYDDTTYHRYPSTTSKPRSLALSSAVSASRQSSINVRRGVNSGFLAVRISTTSIPRTPSKSPARSIGMMRSTSESSLHSHTTDELLKTPSSVSSISIPPLTPKDDDLATPTPFTIDANKILPPLPNPKTGSIRRPAAPGLAGRVKPPVTRLRTTSLGTALSSSASSPNVSKAPPMPSMAVSPSIGTLKQLQLPSRYSQLRESQSRIPGTTKSPVQSSPPSALPKPRTGTGMTYRKSGHPTTANPSMLRMPSTPSLRSSATRF